MPSVSNVDKSISRHSYSAVTSTSAPTKGTDKSTHDISYVPDISPNVAVNEKESHWNSYGYPLDNVEIEV